jgi:CysZ protein
MFDAAFGALRQIFTPPFRAILWKVLALTLALLAGLWLLLDKIILHFVTTPFAEGSFAQGAWPWLETIIAIVAGLGLFVGLVFVVAPVSSLVAGFFLDDLADIVERDDPSIPPGAPLPAAQALWLASKFAALSLVVNLFALILFLIPGVNALVFFIANGYLLGHEYFELAALRYRPLEDVRALRRAHAMELFVGGLAIAVFVAIPVVNLLTPLFGTAFMVRWHRARFLRDAGAPTAPAPLQASRWPSN